MSNRLLLKSSGTADAVPDFDDLELAELVVNTRNGKMFCKTYDGLTYAIVDLTLSSPDEIIASGPGLIGRSASGAGPAALLSGADVVSLLPAATTSAAGKMTEAQATTVALHRGSGTTSSRNALTGLAAGHTWYNTDRSVTETYNGTVWLSPGVYQMTNRSGVTISEGYSTKLNESYSKAVTLTNSYSDPNFIGVCVDGGANNAEITISDTGHRRVLVISSISVGVGDYLESVNTPAGRFSVASVGTPTYGVSARATEASPSGSERLVYAKIGVATYIN
jgi:hypothetical protein